MEIINKILWSIATVLLVASGFYFAKKIDFLHLRIFKMLKILKKKDKNEEGISAFESLSVALGACIGVGSLSGIALAIYKGGIGSIFWTIISCLIIVPNSFIENSLAVIYHKKKDDLFIGGPANYIRDGLGYKKLSLVYAFIIILAYLFGFIPIQANTISKAITTFFNVPALLIGCVIGIICFIIIKNGIKSIAKFSSIFIPIMASVYLLVSLYIIFKNINLIPGIVISIFKEAFNFKALGYGIFSSLIIGIERGIFASEIGAGTSAIAAGSSNQKNPFKQGIVGMFGGYYTIFVVCLSTALIILTSDYNPINYGVVNGIEITLNSLIYHLGTFGNIILYFCLIAFSFSTIISGYYYVETNLKFIYDKISINNILFLQIITTIILIVSTIISPTFIWNTADLLVAMLVIINIFSIFKLRHIFLKKYKEMGSN